MFQKYNEKQILAKTHAYKLTFANTNVFNCVRFFFIK